MSHDALTLSTYESYDALTISRYESYDALTLSTYDAFLITYSCQPCSSAAWGSRRSLLASRPPCVASRLVTVLADLPGHLATLLEENIDIKIGGHTYDI